MPGNQTIPFYSLLKLNDGRWWSCGRTSLACEEDSTARDHRREDGYGDRMYYSVLCQCIRIKGMNRRKQTRPKRNTCSDIDETASEELIDKSSLDARDIESMEEKCSIQQRQRTSSMTTTAEIDQNYSDDSFAEEPPPTAAAQSTTTPDDDVASSPSQDKQTRSLSSPPTADFMDPNPSSPTSNLDNESAFVPLEKIRSEKSALLELSCCSPKREMIEGERKESSGKTVTVHPRLSTHSAAGLGNDQIPMISGSLRSAMQDRQTMSALQHLHPSTSISSLSHCNDLVVASDEQNFVRKLESFVASVDRTNKHGSSAIYPRKSLPRGDLLTGRISSVDGYKSKPINGMSNSRESTSSSSYKYYESCATFLERMTTDQPLDLSSKSKEKSNGFTRLDTVGDVSLAPLSSSYELSTGTGASSLLASLERKFGEHSQILDRIGTLPRACHFGGSLAPSKGSGLYALKMADTNDNCRKNFFYPSTSSASSSHNFIDSSSLRSTKGKDRKINGKTFHYRTNTPRDMDSVKSCDMSELEPDLKRKHNSTNLRCSCNQEFDRLYLLAVHLQESGHKPASGKAGDDIGLDNNRLVRGQDVWLHHGSEQTRQILRCMECHKSFRSLPELTIHMIQTEHYMNLVQPELAHKRISNEPGSSSGSESTDAFCCSFCSKTFDDADALGLHIIEFGHYRRGVTEKRMKTETISIDVSNLSLNPGSCSNYESEMKDLPVLRKETNYAETALKQERQTASRGSLHVSPINRSPDHDERLEFVRESETFDKDDKEPNDDIPPKIPHLERTSPATCPNPSSTYYAAESKDRSSSSSSSDSLNCLPSSAENEDLEIPKLEPIEMMGSSRKLPKVGSSEAKANQPRVVEKDGALKAIQSFINRSFSHSSQDNHKTNRSSASSTDLNRPFHQQNLKTSFTSWHPVSNFLTKLTLQDDSPSTRSSSRKRHHHETERQQKVEDERTKREEQATTSKADHYHRSTETRGFDSRLSLYGYPNSSFTIDGLFKSNAVIAPEQNNDQERGIFNENNRLSFPSSRTVNIQTMPKVVSSPLTPPVVSPSVEMASFGCHSRMKRIKVEGRSHDKDEKTSPRSERKERHGGEMSTLDSLQELVYSRPFKGLETFIHQAPSSNYHWSSTASSSPSDKQNQTLVISTKSSLTKSIPETLILVNPIVTVMPGGMSVGSGASLNITLPPPPPPQISPPDAEITKENCVLSGSPLTDPIDSDCEQYGEFKCRTCKRKFASKGSYRYHRSRYHAYSVIEKSKMKDQMVTSLYSHLNSDQTNKFSKYYQLANELSSKSN